MTVPPSTGQCPFSGGMTSGTRGSFQQPTTRAVPPDSKRMIWVWSTPRTWPASAATASNTSPDDTPQAMSVATRRRAPWLSATSRSRSRLPARDAAIVLKRRPSTPSSPGDASDIRTDRSPPAIRPATPVASRTGRTITRVRYATKSPTSRTAADAVTVAATTAVRAAATECSSAATALLCRAFWKPAHWSRSAASRRSPSPVRSTDRADDRSVRAVAIRGARSSRTYASAAPAIRRARAAWSGPAPAAERTRSVS